MLHINHNATTVLQASRGSAEQTPERWTIFLWEDEKLREMEEVMVGEKIK